MSSATIVNTQAVGRERRIAKKLSKEHARTDPMHIETLCLDAGGVLVFPNWTRVSEALARRGVRVDPAALAAAEPLAKRAVDNGPTIAQSTDQQRSWPYFSLVLENAGVPQNAATDAALAELYAYHQTQNLWEVVPDDVPAALARFRRMGLRLIVVSNANGTLHVCFDRVGLSVCIDAAFDSHWEGVEKPDPRFFELALARVGARPESTMHVGDLYHVDVVGARNASIHPALLDPFDLYEEADCLRVRSLGELADRLEAD
jgi:HAD superfamily hydrolase (TIGR01549 family)